MLTHLPTFSPLRASSFLHLRVFPAPPSHSLNTPGAQEAAGLATNSGRGLKHLAVTEDWPWCIFPQPLQVHLHLQLHSHCVFILYFSSRLDADQFLLQESAQASPLRNIPRLFPTLMDNIFQGVTVAKSTDLETEAGCAGSQLCRVPVSALSVTTFAKLRGLSKTLS